MMFCVQARAPHSPVLIIGTHIDKINSRSQRTLMQQCYQYIDNRYGTRDTRREGYPQVRVVMVIY